MKTNAITRALCLVAVTTCLVVVPLLAQADEAQNTTFSLDLSTSLFPPPDTSLVPDLLDSLRGIKNWRTIKFKEDRVVQRFGVNLHYKNWTGGIVTQPNRKSEFNVIYAGETEPDRLKVTETKLSFYAERHFRNVFNRVSPFVRFGVTRAEYVGLRVRNGIAGESELVETSPQLGLGFFLNFKYVRVRLGLTKFLGDIDDSSMTVGLRIPVGNLFH